MARMFSGLGSRLATAVVALPIVIALIWWEPLRLGFSALVGLIVVVALLEYGAIMTAKGIAVSRFPLAASGALFIALAGYWDPGKCTLLLYVVIVAICAGQLCLADRSLAGIGGSIFGFFYVAWFATHVVWLHEEPHVGPGLVTLLLAISFVNDTAAYFGGILLGKHKMAPILSPNKTWEGAVSGFLCALLCAAVFFGMQSVWGLKTLPDWSLERYLIAGAVLSTLCQVGDLVESSLKRDAGIKDSGSMFPGHGGALDRCDGLLFSAPALYYLSLL